MNNLLNSKALFNVKKCHKKMYILGTTFLNYAVCIYLCIKIVQDFWGFFPVHILTPLYTSLLLYVAAKY